MIPKVIHYCWFGGNPLPPLAIKCINSWRKFLPDYNIIEWNESNFNVNEIKYISQAYNAKKYAFVSDYARFKILYENGGIYFDTDVELINNIEDIVEKGSFMGSESNANHGVLPNIAPGLGLGAEKKLAFYSKILDLYKSLDFINSKKELNLKTVVEYITDLLKQNGLQPTNEIQKVAGIIIYPKEYFNPIDADKKIELTSNSRSIHHYAGTWLPYSSKLKNKMLSRFRRNDLYKFIIAKIKYSYNQLFSKTL